ncbi:MAG: cob(I)yrinic acid a,c-diamide adenosyltransferase [Chitinispirillaceae bacterium]|nr:cob(I)yrinic acid a,c-diamide adenosyltransferase [Chitinispirillaceae bacterium]
MKSDYKEKGYLHIYTGNGKGKTTAALGLALRAVGAGKKVLFTQFLKTSSFSEHKAIERFSDLVSLHCFGTGDFIHGRAKEHHKIAATEGYSTIRSLLAQQHYNVIICDEIIAAANLELLSREQILELVAQKPQSSEMIFTGRNAPGYLVEIADLVTEMVEVKHYYTDGVNARKGIEF